MWFKNVRRAIALFMCFFIMGTLLTAKDASASACYNHDDKTVKVTQTATCGRNGYREYHCSKCGYLVRTETIKATGNHSWGSWTNIKAANCTEGGVRKHTCKTCGKTESETVSALGHSWGSWTTTKSATCTATGTKKRTCSRCSRSETQTIAALGHNTSGSPRIVQATCTKDGYTSATCSRCGVETGTKTVNKSPGHNWGSWTTTKSATCTASGSKKRTCSRCGATETATIAALGHNTSGSPRIVQASCTKDGYTSATCSRCGIETGTKTVNKAPGHNWGSWTTTKAATCTVSGAKKRTCSRCGAIETGTIAALGHDTLGTPVIVHETCTKDGYTSATCSRCHIETGTKSVTKAKHVWGDWKTTKSATCTATGTKQRICSRCSKTETATIAALGHNTLGTPKIVKPTCENDGYTTAVCSRCYCETGTKTVNKALGHNWGNWTTTKSATCTAAGTKQRVCSRCSKTETQTIAALGHDTLGTPVIIHETCEKDGYTSATCSRCHIETGTKSVIKAKHVWGDWKTTKEATCTATGTKQRTCSRCSKAETQTIAALGHNTLGTPKIVKPTCEKDGYTTAVCSRCYCESGTKTVNKALGHNWGNWSTTKSATCTTTGTKVRSCSRCQKNETQVIAALGHDTLGTPVIVHETCIKDGYTSATCSRCHIETGTKSVIKAKHVWGDWKKTKDATCTSTGTKQRTCSRCSKIETETIAALGHNTLGTPRIVKPTCERDGYTTAVCSRCYCESGTPSVIKALGHNWGDWNTKIQAKCKEAGSKERTCTRCDKVETQIIPAEGHNTLGTPRIVQPTCITDGYTTAVCSKCYCESGTKTILPATGKHHWEDWVEDQKPTCVEKGKKHHICNVCHKAEFDEINELGHNVQGYRNISATCEEDGYSGVVCSRCGQVMDGAKIYPATGHDWGNWIVDIEPKGDTIGARHRICKKCQKREDDNLWGGIDSYVIHFDGNGNLDGQMEDMKLKYGAWFIVPECDFDYGDGFDCWCTTPDGTGQCYKVGFSDQERGLVTDRSITNITLYAIWNECAVTYHDGVSKEPLGKPVTEGHVFSPKGTYMYPSLKIDGLILIGWGTSSNGLIGGKIEYKMGTKSANKIIYDLYPVYRIEEKNKWAVFYDPNGGIGGPGVQFYDKGKEDITVTNGEPTRTGYTFDGWEYPYKNDRMYEGSWIQSDWFVNDAVRLVATWKYNDRELVLDYDYDGKIDEITLNYENYKLPTPKGRDGFDFLGWGVEKNVPLYSGGQEFNPSGGTTKLYAVWKPVQFVIEYYDGFTGRLLKKEDSDVTQKLRGNLCEIDGLVFEGWDELIPMVQPHAPTYYVHKDHELGASAGELDYTKKTVKLYSKYSFKKHDGILVVYHPNGANSVPKSEVFSSYSSLVIKSGSGVRKPGYKFIEWKSFTSLYWKDGKIVGGPNEILMIASWGITAKLTLNYGRAGIPEKEITGKFTPDQTVKVSDLDDTEWKGHYLQGWNDQNGNYYPVLGEITIPTVNTVLTAVWGDNKYKIYYHNGFSGDLYGVPQEVGITGKINYTPPTEDGYTFKGWVTDWPDELPVDLKPDYYNGEERTFSKDLHLYSCFIEDSAASVGSITVVYNNKGGKGGPGVVSYYRYSDSPSFTVSKLEPERAGYKFLGWSKEFSAMSVDFYPEDTCGGYDIPQDGKLTLYAVWGFDHTSDLKAELQLRFGKDVMRDSFFDHEYKSTKWHKVNDFCYFVIKTENEVDSNYMKYMTSSVMIIEFKNGKWSIESIGLKQSFGDAWRYYVTTHNSDTMGRVITLGLDALGYLVGLALDPIDPFWSRYSAYVMVYELLAGDNDTEDFRHEYSVELYSSLVDSIWEQGRLAGMNEDEISVFIEDNYTLLQRACDESAAEAVDSVHGVIEYGTAATDEALSFVKRWNEDAGLVNDYLGDICEAYGLEKNGVPLIKYSESEATTLGRITSVLSVFVDITRYAGSQLDVTGGNQNSALAAFRDELTEQGFSEKIAEEFPTLLVKMYKKYYGITD